MMMIAAAAAATADCRAVAMVVAVVEEPRDAGGREGKETRAKGERRRRWW